MIMEFVGIGSRLVMIIPGQVGITQGLGSDGKFVANLNAGGSGQGGSGQDW